MKPVNQMVLLAMAQQTPEGGQHELESRTLGTVMSTLRTKFGASRLPPYGVVIKSYDKVFVSFYNFFYHIFSLPTYQSGSVPL